MKVIVNGVCNGTCFRCDSKEDVRQVNIPARPYNGPLCMKCIAKESNGPVEKVTRKPSEKKVAK